MMAHTLHSVPTQMTLIAPSGPVEHPPKGVTLAEITAQATGYELYIGDQPNNYGPAAGKVDKWATWEAAIKVGIMNFADDSTTVDQYVAERRIAMKPWMKLAYRWARENPDQTLYLDGERFYWMVFQRGEYVVLQLPDHSHGGDKEYVSRDGINRVLIDKD